MSESNRPIKSAIAAVGAVLLAALAVIAHNATGVVHATAPIIDTTMQVQGVRTTLRNLAEGTYLEKQVPGLFCSVSSSMWTSGELPEDVTDWKGFVAARLGLTADPAGALQGMVNRLQTALELAQYNPKLAGDFYRICHGL